MEAFEEGLVPENEYEESEDEYDSEDSNGTIINVLSDDQTKCKDDDE